MKEDGVLEAKTHLSALIDEVTSGAEIDDHAPRQADSEARSG